MDRHSARLTLERLTMLGAGLAIVAAELEPLIRGADDEVSPLTLLDPAELLPPRPTPSADMARVADRLRESAASLQGARRLLDTIERTVRRADAEEPPDTAPGAPESVSGRDRESYATETVAASSPPDGTPHYPACSDHNCVSGCYWYRTAGCRGCEHGGGHRTGCPAYDAHDG